MMSPAPEKVDGKPRKGSEVIGDLSRAIRKVGSVIKVGGESGRQKAGLTREFAQSLFQDAGKKIDSAAIAAFIQRVGTDSMVMSTEARKLVDYVGESDKITARDVAEVTSETPEEKVFKMVDAVGAKRPGEAMRLLDELFETGDKPENDSPKILANIARQFRLLWQVKMLLASGARVFSKDAVPEKVRALLPSTPNILDLVARQSWQEDRLKQAASRWSREDLARCFHAIAKTDAMLKGIEGDIEDARMAMEMLVLDLAR